MGRIAVQGRVRRLLLLVALPAALIVAAIAPTANAEAIPGRYIVVLEDSVDHPGEVATEHARRYDIDRS